MRLRAGPGGLSQHALLVATAPGFFSSSIEKCSLLLGQPFFLLATSPAGFHQPEGYAFDFTVPFEPYDRFAHLAQGEARPVAGLLQEVAGLRADNLRTLHVMDLSPADYGRTGTHPALGRVSLGELLSTWVVHDLNHLAQIARTLAHQDRDAVGPWARFLPILDR
jgi:hypothetical protein